MSEGVEIAAVALAVAVADGASVAGVVDTHAAHQCERGGSGSSDTLEAASLRAPGSHPLSLSRIAMKATVKATNCDTQAVTSVGIKWFMNRRDLETARARRFGMEPHPRALSRDRAPARRRRIRRSRIDPLTCPFNVQLEPVTASRQEVDR